MKKYFSLMKKNTIMFLVINLLILGLIIGTGVLLYSISLLTGIENTLRLIGSGIFIIILILLILFLIKSLYKNKKTFYIPLIIISILYIGGTNYLGYQIIKAYGSLNNFTTSTTSYSSSIVTLKDNKVEDIKDLGNSKIGILNDKKSIDGYEIPNEIIKEENLKVK